MNTDVQHFFGGGGQTDIQPLTLLLAVVACILLLCLPRRHAFVPLLAGTVLIPLGQQLVVADVHITISRLLLLVGWTRLFIVKAQTRRKLVAGWSRLDTAFLTYCIVNLVTYVLLWGGASGALVNRLGFLCNALGMYFLMRFFMREDADLTCATKTLIVVFCVVSLGMAVELATGSNFFSRLGGVPELSTVRDGKIRAAGPFAHPLTAGAIGATLLPLALGLWWIDKRQKWMALTGIVVAIVMALASRSSTGVLSLAAGLLGMVFWRWRRYLRAMRWIVVFVLVALHLVMKAPVWALLARIDLTGSSSGYHRYALIDQFIIRFSEWWLIGTRTTADWGWDMWDTINSYVAAGTSGGLANLAAYLAIFVVGFKLAGRRRHLAAFDPRLAKQLWIMGVLLFVHAVTCFGIDYFDQSQFVWYTGLAMLGTTVTLAPAVGAEKLSAPEETTISRPKFQRSEPEALQAR